MSTERRPPIDVARDILAQKYPDALFGFAAGSFNRGEDTAFSDIDLVVIFERREHAWRDAFTFDHWPVEIFAHDPETLAAFMQGDVERGESVLPTMVAEGPTVPAGHPLAEILKTEARAIIASGPPQWDRNKIDLERYMITGLIDDLRDPRSPIEAAANIGVLHERLGNFYLRARRLWSASHKHIPRKLAKADPELAWRWNEAFLNAWTGQRDSVIQLADRILKPYGGLLFDGYRVDAPKDKRIVKTIEC